MPVAHITIHAYRSWTEDNPRGYVQRGKPGVRPPNERLAKHQIANHPPVLFDECEKAFLIESAQEICAKNKWRLHAASVTPTHVHLRGGVIATLESAEQRSRRFNRI